MFEAGSCQILLH